MDKKKQPLVSVIIPTYNPKKYLLRALKSVSKQSYSNVEVIIVDDGSEVDVKSLLRNYLKNKNLKLYRKKNQGPSVARNFGVEKAKGEYVAFLDDDDVWLKNKLDLQYEFLTSNNLDVVISGLKTKSRDKMIIKKNNLPQEKSQQVLYFFQDKIKEITPTIFMKKSVFLEVEGFREKLKRKEDHFLLMILCSKFNVGSLNQPTYIRYRRFDGLSSSTSPELLISNAKIFIEYCKKELGDFSLPYNKFYSKIYVESSYLYFLRKDLIQSLRCLRSSFKYNLFNKKNYQMLILIPFIGISEKISKLKNKLNL